MYVVIRNSDRKYVASEHQTISYTRNLRKARIFDTHGEAKCYANHDETTDTVVGQLSLGPVVPLGIGLKPIPVN